MSQRYKHNYFILTGAMGAGKSTTLKELKKLGLLCIDEPARDILAEQRAIDSNGVPDRDPKLFTELLLSRSIHQFKHMENYQGPIVYDRGILDNLSYAKLFELNLKPYINAAHLFKYNKQVFFLPAWEAIYENDDERKMTFEQAKQFGEVLRKSYEDLGYHIIEIPMTDPPARAAFIIQREFDLTHAKIEKLLFKYKEGFLGCKE